jgi:hypothetical protein
MRIYFIILGVIMSGFSIAAEVKVNPGKYFDYYHIEFELKPGEYTVNHNYGFSSKGQFEIFIPKEKFPISAPNCSKNIIVRMPASLNLPVDKKAVEKKRKLFDALSKSEPKRIIIELNPYFKIISKNPLDFELQYCNVFFRQKNDKYYDHL